MYLFIKGITTGQKFPPLGFSTTLFKIQDLC